MNTVARVAKAADIQELASINQHFNYLMPPETEITELESAPRTQLDPICRIGQTDHESLPGGRGKLPKENLSWANNNLRQRTPKLLGQTLEWEYTPVMSLGKEKWENQNVANK